MGPPHEGSECSETRTFIYIYIYVCMYICMYVCMYINYFVSRVDDVVISDGDEVITTQQNNRFPRRSEYR